MMWHRIFSAACCWSSTWFTGCLHLEPVSASSGLPLICACTLQFISTLEANIFAKIDAIVNVSITKVVTGSAVVMNSVAFTGADSSAASAEQTALYQTLASGDTTIFGTSFGSVVVSNITQGNTTNPSKSAFLFFALSHVACCLTTCLPRIIHSRLCKSVHPWGHGDMYLRSNLSRKDNTLSAMLLGMLTCINLAR